MNAKVMAVAGLVAILQAANGMAMADITIETVPVGNSGNAADDTGFGAVSYDYNIGRYEVTAGQYTAFLNAQAGIDMYGLYSPQMADTQSGSGISRSWSPSEGRYFYSVDAAFVNRPVNYVSWGDAARFANWLHNGQPTGPKGLGSTEDGAYYLNGATSTAALLAVTREADWEWAITSENEWYKAAYYNPGTSSYYDYPTSSSNAPGRDMGEGTNPGNNANYRGSPYPIDSPYYTTIVGEFELSDSPYGTFDQGGNVWEWIEAIRGGGSYRGLRGGSFYEPTGSGYLHAGFSSIGWEPTYESLELGFRVSQVPEPASLAVLCLGVPGVLLKWRRGRMSGTGNPRKPSP